MVINPYLIEELENHGLWNEKTRQNIIYHKGSAQSIPGLSEELKLRFRKASELPQKVILDMAVARGPFVDQSQSMNLFMDRTDQTHTN